MDMQWTKKTEKFNFKYQLRWSFTELKSYFSHIPIMHKNNIFLDPVYPDAQSADSNSKVYPILGIGKYFLGIDKYILGIGKYILRK